MKEQTRTNSELIEENALLKQRIQELEQSESERKQVEEALRKSEENYRQLFDNSPTGIFQANFRKGKFTKANDAFCEYLGYGQKEITSLSPYDVLTNEGKQLFSERLSKMISGDTVPDNPEFEIIRKNGKRRWVQLNTKNIYDSEGLVGADVVAHDITERKRAEEELQRVHDELEQHVADRTKELIRANEKLRTEITERKRAEKELREGEARYRAIVEDQEEMIRRFLPDGTLTFVNDACCRYYGKSRDELLGKKFMPLIAEADREMVAKRIAALSLQKPSEINEQRTVSASGKVRWQQWVNRALFDEQGCLTEIQAVGRDITTLKLTEERLRKSEKRFRSLTEKIPIGIFIYEGTKINYVNPACERITGYKRGELYLLDIWEIAHPDYKDIIREYMHRRQQGDPVPELHEVKIITKSGEERWLERGAIAIELQRKSFVLVTVIDVTERKLAEEDLKNSEQKYRGLMENASDAILIADTKGNILDSNRKAEELWGCTKEDLVQMHYTQLIPMPELDRAIAAFKEILDKGTGALSGGFIQSTDGNIIPVDITSNVIEYAGRKIVQGSIRDITEHKRSEDQLENLVTERTSELSLKNEQLQLQIKERKSTEAALKKKTKELEQHTDKLRELNAALKVLLKQREEDKNDLEEKVTLNVKELLLPCLEVLKNSRLDATQKVVARILELNLNEIISPFAHTLSSKYYCLTPREIEIANLIRQGKSTKEISNIIGISNGSIIVHRNHIRKKLGIISKKINLRSHLMSLS